MRARAMPDDLQTTWQRIPLDALVPLAESARHVKAIYIEEREPRSNSSISSASSETSGSC